VSERIAELVVGYDGSDRADEALRLARRIAPEGTTVTVVNAYWVPVEIRAYEFFEDLRAGFRRMAEETLDLARPAFEGADLEVRYEAREGHAAEVVGDLARERGADVIVMGSRGLGRVRAAIGSTVLDLLHDAPCPVLVASRGAEAQAAPRP
jgi:nucleotide-binding universal stress UspA family protein